MIKNISFENKIANLFNFRPKFWAIVCNADGKRF
jgi:hypothetical protein